MPKESARKDGRRGKGAKRRTQTGDKQGIRGLSESDAEKAMQYLRRAAEDRQGGVTDEVATEMIELRTSPPHNLSPTPVTFGGKKIYDQKAVKRKPSYIRSARSPLQQGLSSPRKKTREHSQFRPNSVAATRGDLKGSVDALADKVRKKREREPSSERVDGQRPKRRQTSGSGTLYDKQLHYKRYINDKIVETCKREGAGITTIKVGAYDGYPCLMVDLSLIKNIPGYREDNQNETAITQLIMSYYIGLVNKIAVSRGYETELTQRQSFGFASPSVSDTPPSLRINIGLMPPGYADVHIEALKVLNNEVKRVIEMQPPKRIYNDKSGAYITAIKYVEGERFRTRKREMKETLNASDWWNYAFGPLEKTPGGSVLHNCMRQQERLDDVNAMAQNGKSLDFCLEKTLQAAQAIEGTDGKLTLTSKGVRTYQYSRVERDAQTETQAQHDLEATRLLQDTLDSYGDALQALRERHSDSEEMNKHLQALEAGLNAENPQLDSLLAILNDYVVLYARKDLRDEMGTLDSERDKGFISYGSDSEVDDDDAKVHMTKVITYSGLDAGYVALELEESIAKTKGTSIQIDLADVYYEFGINPKVKKYSQNTTQRRVLMRDNNPARVRATKEQGTTSEKIGRTGKIAWIIDTTSSTQREMKRIIDDFCTDETAERLYLISSGFKNEQAGADKNSYGTIRLVTKTAHGVQDHETLKKEYYAHHDPQIEAAHAHRRLMRQIGMTPTNISILQSDSETQPERRTPLGGAMSADIKSTWT
jgi:hypothetical protein